jgi:hypothetical protein
MWQIIVFFVLLLSYPDDDGKAMYVINNVMKHILYIHLFALHKRN